MRRVKTHHSDPAKCTEDYLGSVPANAWDLLVPSDSGEYDDFCKRVRRLSIYEEERSYVMDLQRAFRIPLRPNESVKATMIRARLKILKLRAKATREGAEDAGFGELPSDPLE